MHKLALQEVFYGWKEFTLRNLINGVFDEGGVSKDVELTEARADIMKHLFDCMISKIASFKVVRFLELRHKEGTFDEVTLAHCFFRWHGVSIPAAPSMPPKPAKRRARKKKR